MRVNIYVETYFIKPRPQNYAFTTSIPCKLSKRAGNITLYFYTPPGYKRPSKNAGNEPSLKPGYPLIVNFHGGGFAIGHATDDIRWASTVLDHVGAIIVSVGYRKGPEHPAPTAVEDCVDALRWLWAHASDYNIDRSRTVLTGFSAGANLSFTVPLRHFVDRESNGTCEEDGQLAGIISFYPSVDQTRTREEKFESNPVSLTKGSMSHGLYTLLDNAYYKDVPRSNLEGVDFSPALASKDTLLRGLPTKVAIYTCEYDQLLVEGEEFRKLLLGMGKVVGGRMFEQVPHAFDKPAGKFPKLREAMYMDAVEQIKTMI